MIAVISAPCSKGHHGICGQHSGQTDSLQTVCGCSCHRAGKLPESPRTRLRAPEVVGQGQAADNAQNGAPRPADAAVWRVIEVYALGRTGEPLSDAILAMWSAMLGVE